MEINEIPAPAFVKNDKGMITVFLPAFEGNPENPTIKAINENTLHFQRSKTGDINLTNIDAEIMNELKNVSKILVVETNVLKSIELLEKALDNLAKNKIADPENAQNEVLNTVQNAYECNVNG